MLITFDKIKGKSKDLLRDWDLTYQVLLPTFDDSAVALRLCQCLL